MGYDIGCGFETTLASSSLGPLTKSMNFRSLVGLFHGHAHNRICQLRNLGTYVKGLGLEDLEGCEWLFSKLNALASLIRYSSRFHQHQALSSYFAHLDHFDTYAHLSDFLVNNYHQALAILDTQPALH
jgi:Kyakuja-Dileera-Zisupton transposase